MGSRDPSGWGDGLALQQRAEDPPARRRPQPPHSEDLKLPNAFAGNPKDLPDLLQRLPVPVIHPESPPKNLAFSGREGSQDRLGSFPCVERDRYVDRRGRRVIREGVPEWMIAMLSEWRLE